MPAFALGHFSLPSKGEDQPPMPELADIEECALRCLNETNGEPTCERIEVDATSGECTVHASLAGKLGKVSVGWARSREPATCFLKHTSGRAGGGRGLAAACG